MIDGSALKTSSPFTGIPIPDPDLAAAAGTRGFTPQAVRLL